MYSLTTPVAIATIQKLQNSSNVTHAKSQTRRHTDKQKKR